MEGPQTWSVVKFLDEDTVSVVPTKWINNDQCFWPSFPNQEKVNQAIKSQLIDICWPTHKVSVFRNSTHDDYNIVHAEARKAEETSDLTSSDADDDMIKKKRRILSRRAFSSDEEEEPVYYKTPPILKKKTEKASNKCFQNESKTTTNDGISSISGNTQTPSSSRTKEANHVPQVVVSIPTTPSCDESCSCCPHTVKYLKEILRQQHLSRSLLNEIFHKIDEKKPQEIERDSSVFKEFNLPFTNTDELVKFNEQFKIEENFSKAVGEIARFGGDTTYDFVKRSLSFFLSNEVAVKYSWLGRRAKDPFNNLTIAQLIIAAVEKANKSPDKKTTENEISKWLRRAGDRKKC